MMIEANTLGVIKRYVDQIESKLKNTDEFCECDYAHHNEISILYYRQLIEMVESVVKKEL